MALVDAKYARLAQAILDFGYTYTDPTRNNVGLRQVSSHQLILPVDKGAFPLLTTKRVWWRGVAAELLWILSGESHIRYLINQGVDIWTEDAANYKGGDSTFVGRVYGPQLRRWTDKGNEPVDQLHRLLWNLKYTPMNRRHIVSYWNAAEIDECALPPCHWSWEIIPEPDLLASMAAGETRYNFTLKWHQRSVDAFLGLPFDIAHYAALGFLIENWTGMRFRKLIGDLSNVHFYEPHIPQVKKQLERDVGLYGPRFSLARDQTAPEDLQLTDLIITDYKPLGKLPGQLFTQTTK